MNNVTNHTPSIQSEMPKNSNPNPVVVDTPKGVDAILKDSPKTTVRGNGDLSAEPLSGNFIDNTAGSKKADQLKNIIIPSVVKNNPEFENIDKPVVGLDTGKLAPKKDVDDLDEDNESGTDIDQIKKVSQQNITNPAISIQSILKEMVNGLIDLNKKPEIEANLSKDIHGHYELGTFTIDGTDEIFYKIDVNYAVHVSIADGQGIDRQVQIPNPSLKRTVYTNAADPEQAIFAVYNYVKVVQEIALASDTHLGHLQGIDHNDLPDLIIQQTFSFHFGYNKLGKLESLDSIQIGKKSNIRMSGPQSKFIYDSATTSKPQPIKDEDVAGLPQGTEIFTTEVEALFHASYTVQEDSYYDSLEKNNLLLKRTKEIKNEIAKKEAEFAELKAIFTKEPWIKWFGSRKKTDQYQKFLDGSKLKKASRNDVSKQAAAIQEAQNKIDQFVTTFGKKQVEELATLEFVETQLEDPEFATQKLDPTDLNLIHAVGILYPNNVILHPPLGSGPNSILNQVKECLSLKHRERKQLMALQKEKLAIEENRDSENDYFRQRLKTLQTIQRQIQRLKDQLIGLKKRADKESQSPDSSKQKRAKEVSHSIDKQLDIQERLKINQKFIDEIHHDVK